ncbi:TetR/AcrR family transcriptional regulator [Kribbella albertanoniae]|nr:TetR/AcrR family transcriptional regulator [Kribbella albertanoniae]
MTDATKAVMPERGTATRERILATAERLFAEYGVLSVSNRQISQAAGQGNNAAVSYHFGSRTALIQAIVRRHTEQIEQLRLQRLADADSFTSLRDWVDCLVRPYLAYLDSLGSPTWFARFSAQLMTDPELRDIMITESLTSPTLLVILDGQNRHLAELPLAVREERWGMVHQLLVHVWAERERALAEGTPTPRSSWDDAATGLIDAVVGLLTAPVSPGV